MIRQQIQEFKKKLERPTNFVNALELDLFRVFCDYLRNEKFGETSLLEDTFEGDKTHPDLVTEELTAEANSDNFISFVSDKIEEHMATNDGYNKPYVFIHGIGKKEQGGKILIRSEKKDNALHIEVSDTGAGMDPGTLQGLRDKLKGEPSDVRVGIGIGNLYQRLNTLYGEDSLHIESEAGEGTQVFVTIPIS